MRRITTVFCNVWSNPGALMNQVTFKRAACFLALVGVTFTFASAKEPADEKEPVSKIKRTAATAPAAEAALPECLEKLKLSQPQQTEVRGIMQKYDASIAAVWNQFGGKYMAQVQAEVELLAAIEDHLSEAQRTTVRDERRRTAHEEIAMQGTKSKLNQAKEKPADAADQAKAGAGITLTSEQEATAETIHAKYVSRLRSLNRDIQGLHTRLVSLEADKLVEIEKILTKEQLAQLRDGRLNVAAGAKVTSTK
jgi:hypothetical protein